MTDRKRILTTATLVMVCLAVVVTATGTVVLYRSALAEKQSALLAFAQREAQVIEAIFRNNSKEHGPADHADHANLTSIRNCPKCLARIAAIKQIFREGGNLQSGWGGGVEFVVGRRDGDTIHFLLPSRHAKQGDMHEPMNVPWESDLAEPMRLALSGLSGIVDAKDYRGVVVLAAYAPVGLLGWGVVAKIDMAEVRAPFVTSVRNSLAFAALAILVGLIVLRNRLNPLIQRSEDSKAKALHALSELRSQKYAMDQHSIIAITDPSGKIAYANDKFCQVSQYSRKELIGQDHRIIKADHHPRAFFAELWKTIAAGKVWHGEICNRAKDGSLYWVDTTIVPFNDENGRIKQYVAIRTETTERRITEERLRKNSEILNEAKIAAESANRAKSEFLANMSHEIRTPLHGILSFAQFGQKKALTADPEKLLDYFEKIDTCSQRLLVLLSDVLDLAKMESGRMRYEFKPTDLRIVLRSVLSEFDSLLANRNIIIDHAEPGAELRLTVDENRMAQVVRNLLSNAAKFSSDGGTIRIDVNEDDEGVRISIRDQGKGIPEDELETVFDMFVQSSKTRSGAGGTGLGLSICREIVEAHQGRIWCENHPDGGAVFHVVLPQTMRGGSSGERAKPRDATKPQETIGRAPAIGVS